MGVFVVRHYLTIQRGGKAPVRRSHMGNECSKFKKRMDLKFKSLLVCVCVCVRADISPVENGNVSHLVSSVCLPSPSPRLAGLITLPVSLLTPFLLEFKFKPTSPQLGRHVF